MRYVDINMSEFKVFFDRLGKAANGNFKKEMVKFLEGLGFEFLRILEDEIIRRNVNNVWELNEGYLTLVVGTKVQYASYANDGHWTCKKGEIQRYIPGYWDGDEFIYDKSSKSGMVLKQKWIKGKPYWNNALDLLEKMYPEFLDKKLQEWLDSYFVI